MLRKEGWILLVALAALVGLAWYLNQPNSPTKNNATQTPTTKPTRYLIPLDSASISGLRITSLDGAAVFLLRGPGGVWIVAEPFQGIADQGQAESAITQLTTLRILAALDSAPPPSATGLDAPGYTLTVTTTDGQTLNYKVGKLTVTNTGYYIEDDAGSVQVVTRANLDSLTGWVSQPPYAETPTPSPAPTETLTPAPAGTATLEPSPTSKP